MDYEQKLKLAKEALESGSYDRETIEHIFPELKESEGDRIRRSLIDGFKRYDDGALFNGCLVREILPWLEKQGDKDKLIKELEQKSIDNLTPQEAMDIAIAKCLEQGEQKPFDYEHANIQQKDFAPQEEYEDAMAVEQNAILREANSM